MTLPLPPRDFTAPIPNEPFSYTEKYYVETTQGRVPLSTSLEVNPETGSVSLAT